MDLKETVKKQVQRSVLLSEERKKKLLEKLDSCNETQLKALHLTLMDESAALDHLFMKVIEKKVKDREGMKFVKEMLKVVMEGRKGIFTEQEAKESTTVDDAAEKLLSELD
jgi:hypothetical protein